MSPSAHADTPVSGNQTGTWTAAQSPYLVVGTVYVPSGGTLTIEPGVTVRFASGIAIAGMSGGTLSAEGTPSQPITFTSAAASPAPGDWAFITFNASATGRLRHCVIQYAGGAGNPAAVVLGSSGVVVYSCQFSSVANDAVQVQGGATPVLRGNWFRAPIGRFGVSNHHAGDAVQRRRELLGPSERAVSPNPQSNQPRCSGRRRCSLQPVA
ncbi:MAG: hypothetical protein RMM58_03985 [Chloroflexota bacterium]|nr:hypothetical protein [Dehalococcoidia bacterium]MDW8253021.1 hypothetical protein [Chloroflexota bacterium]